MIDITEGDEGKADGDTKAEAEADTTAEGDATADATADGSGDGAASKGRRFRVLVDHEERGPVLSLAAMQGLLLAGVGAKLVTYVYREDALIVFAFYIAGFGVSALSTLRNYVLAGDVHQGVQLLSWKPEKQSLVLVSKHMGATSSHACEFLLHDGTLHLTLAQETPSEGPQLRIFNYSKHLAECRRGTVLNARASFHVAAPITRLHRVAISGGGHGATRRQALLWAGTDGSIGHVTPVDESAFRRLAYVTTKMAVGLVHTAGLHPRAYRAFHTPASSSRELKSLIDGTLGIRFLELSDEQQRKLALQIGSTPRKVCQALEELCAQLP